MKLPVKPPSTIATLAKLRSRGDTLARLLSVPWDVAPDERYRHWDTFRHALPRSGFTAEQQWLMVKTARRQQYRPLPLVDTSGEPFVFCLPLPALEMIASVDRFAHGVDDSDVELEGSYSFLFDSIAEEAITSSQLEGASTTRAVAKEMLASGRAARTNSERMILSNFQALEYVREIASLPLTPERVLELHRRVTEGTLDEPTASGRLRRADEDTVIDDEVGNRLHTPPPYPQLEERMKLMCRFANGVGFDGYMPPVVRAILLHFWLAYDHPFYDGNGRTARALFYWSMLNQGYSLIEYVSISNILRRARAKYSRAFLYVENDENDATYFVLYQLKVLLRAIESLQSWATRKLAERSHVRDSSLNLRQLETLEFLLGGKSRQVTTPSHARKYSVGIETARLDLNELVSRGLAIRVRDGRSFVYVAVR